MISNLQQDISTSYVSIYSVAPLSLAQLYPSIGTVPSRAPSAAASQSEESEAPSPERNPEPDTATIQTSSSEQGLITLLQLNLQVKVILSEDQTALMAKIITGTDTQSPPLPRLLSRPLPRPVSFLLPRTRE